MHHTSLIRPEKHTALSRELLTWSVSAFGFALYSYTERIPPPLGLRLQPREPVLPSASLCIMHCVLRIPMFVPSLTILIWSLPIRDAPLGEGD